MDLRVAGPPALAHDFVRFLRVGSDSGDQECPTLVLRCRSQLSQ